MDRDYSIVGSAKGDGKTFYFRHLRPRHSQGVQKEHGKGGIDFLRVRNFYIVSELKC
jgi:hypothetical protein